MFVNPFDRMKQIREENEKKLKHEEEQRKKYQKLGKELGLTKELLKEDIVPSFLKNVVAGEDQKSNVPPFGMSTGDVADFQNYDYQSNAPSFGGEISSNDNSEYANPNISFGAEMNQTFSQPGQSYQNNSLESMLPNGNDIPIFAPNDSQLITKDTSFDLNSDHNSDIQQFQSSISHYEKMETNNLQNVEYDESFFDVNQNAIDQIDAILNMNSQIPQFISGEIEDIISKINSNDTNDKFFAIFGDVKNNSDLVSEIKKETDTLLNIDINARKIFLYGTPFFFLLKMIINGLDFASLDDKKVFWDRVAIFLSATDFGRKIEDLQIIFEGELSIDDPLESINKEFKNFLIAYNINKPIIININDFRGVDFNDINKTILFITTIFADVKNLKFIFNIPYENYLLYFRLNGEKSWISLFDIVVNTQKKLDNNANSKSMVEETQTAELDNLNFENNFQSSSLSSQPVENSIDNFSLPTQSGSSFVPEPQPMIEQVMPMKEQTPIPNNITFENNFSQSKVVKNNEKKPEKKDSERNMFDDTIEIRINIDENLKRAERLKQELEDDDMQKIQHQLFEMQIDPAVLADDNVEETSDQIFSNFNISGYRNFAKSEAGTMGQDDDIDLNPKKPNRKVTDPNLDKKLTDFNNNLNVQKDVDIKENILHQQVLSGTRDNSLIKIKGNWNDLDKR